MNPPRPSALDPLSEYEPAKTRPQATHHSPPASLALVAPFPFHPAPKRASRCWGPIADMDRASLARRPLQ